MKRIVHATLAALAIGAAALAALARQPEPPLSSDEVSAVELAGWIRDRRPGLVIVDLRGTAAMQRGALPGARTVDELVDSGIGLDTLVIYADRQADAATMRGFARRVLMLRGGIEAWNAQVLFPVVRADASTAQRREFEARAKLSRYFGGSPRVLEPGARRQPGRSRRGC
jgi:hypothetical protein